MVCLTSAILDHLAPAPALAHPPTRLINSHKGHHGDHWSHPSYRVHNQKASLDKLTKAETNDRVLPDILFINTINMCVICFNVILFYRAGVYWIYIVGVKRKSMRHFMRHFMGMRHFMRHLVKDQLSFIFNRSSAENP